MPDQIPQGMQSFVFNVQRPIFKDRRVREALGYALDFEWLNKNFFYGQYTRTRSYFTNTHYEAKGLPSAEELKILEPIRGQDPARGLHEGIPAARHRRHGQYPRPAPRGHGPVQAGRAGR